MQILIDFKHQSEAKLRNEFRTHTDGILRAVTLDFAFWLYCNYHIVLVVTCLNRDKKENKSVGGSPTSRHLETPCKAVDYRIRDWPEGAVAEAEKYLNDTWRGIIYVLVEKSHIHLQLSRKWFPQGSLK